MPTLKQKLPSLSALITFESAARHLSFTKASEELHVTQAAVSRQIKALENDLGKALFERKHRSLKLTPVAEKLLQAVSVGLVHISDATDEIRQYSVDSYFTVSATIAFITLKLNPLLAEFQTLYPNTDIRVLATDRDIDLEMESVDLAISCGDYAQYKGFKSTHLFDDEVFPVCSPNYLTSHSTLKKPEDLRQHQLIHLDPQHWHDISWEAIDWQFWLKSQSVEPLMQSHGLTMNNYPLLLQAAINGQGVALGWRHLVEDFLEQGLLVRPLKESYLSQRAYYLVESTQRRLSDPAQRFRDWILGQLLKVDF